MEISPQTSPRQSSPKDDPLDRFALEIARRNKLEGESLQLLSGVFPGAPRLYTASSRVGWKRAGSNLSTSGAAKRQRGRQR